MITFNKIGKLVAGAVLAMSSSVALADHVPGLAFSESNFTINPGAVGLGGCNVSATNPSGTCTARFIDFSYRAEVDQTNTGAGSASFTESGGGFFGTFRTDLGDNPVPRTGLGNDYQMYFVFTAAGNTAPGGGGTIDGTFTAFDYTIYLDPGFNTVLTNPGTGGANETVTVTSGGADDIAVLRGTLEVGGFHIAGGLANGDFDVIATATRIGNFFGGAAFADGDARTDINGVNSLIAGLPTVPVLDAMGNPVLDALGNPVFAVAPFNNATDITIDGSGNASFEPVPVPEPASLALFGLALAGVAFSRRGKKA